MFGQSVANEDSSTKDGFQADIRKYLQLPLGEETMSFSGVVADSVPEHEGQLPWRGIGPKYISMAKFQQSDGKGYQLLAEEIRKVGRQFFDYFDREDLDNTRRYISDVFLFDGRRALDRSLECLREYGRSRRNGMFGISVEYDHIHIIHDCSYSGRSCRCTFKEKIEPFGQFGPNRRYNKPLWKFTRTDWYDVFVYFFLAKRGTRQIWFGGKNWETPSDGKPVYLKCFGIFKIYCLTAELVRWEEIYHSRRSMVRCEDSGSDSECSGQTNKRSRRAADFPSDFEIYGKRSKPIGKYVLIKQETKTLLKKYYCSPLSAIRDIDEFRQNEMLSNPKNKDYVNAAIDDFAKDVNTMSLREIYEILESGDPQFMLSIDYGSVDESLKVIDELIRYQCDDDDEKVSFFLRSLVDILDKRIPKCNGLVIHSPPSSGKNFFFDMICAICLNYGQLGQANKYNVFAFQEAPNKRLLLWNEPNYESSVTDTLKMLFGGDPLTVRVKHAQDTHVRRTPIIVMTNNFVNFMVDAAFASRIIKFTWKGAPFLKDIEFKPHPMSFFELLDKYNIDF